MKFNEFPARYVLAILGMFGSFTKYMLKVNLNVAIVEMVIFDPTEVDITAHDGGMWKTSIVDNNLTLPLDRVRNSSSSETQDGDRLSCAGASNLDKEFNDSVVSANETKFPWTANQQGLVLGSFSYGETVAQVAVAYLSRRFGHVRVIGITVFGGGVMTLLTPIVTKSLGIAGLVVTRVLVGVFTGATTSLLMGLAGLWSPPQQRSIIMSIMIAGVPLAYGCIMPVAGVLAARLGWESVFYVTGTGGLLWVLLWILLAYETPSDHPRISVREKEFINSSLGREDEDKTLSRKVPWGKLLRSGPVMSIIAANVCSLYGYQTLSSLFPTYLKTVQNLDTQTSGIISAIPFVVSGPLYIISGIVADFFIAKGIRVLTVRRACTVIGMAISAIAIVGLGYTGCNLIAAASLATIVVAMDALATPGFKACTLDIAPNLSGLIFSMAETVGLTTGFFAPQVTGVLRESYGFFGWQIAFWIAAGIYLVGMGQFIVFGTNEKQAWATDRKKRPSSVVTIEETVAERNLSS